jgi:disulfide bond formation protein DsbB
MQSLLPIVNKGAAMFVVLAQIFSLLILILFFTKRKYQIQSFISKNILTVGFLVSLSAVLVSLFYSDVIGYAPCFFCWLQRVFIYPLVPLFGLAIWKRDRGILDYALILSLIGLLIGAYQTLIYYFNVTLVPCPASGPSCAAHYVSELNGYVSIPMMSLTAFILLIVLLVSAKYRKYD